MTTLEQEHKSQRKKELENPVLSHKIFSILIITFHILSIMSLYNKQCSAFSNSTLKSLRHVESVHEGKKSFKCNVRDTPFSEKSNLNGHIESVHGGFQLLDLIIPELKSHVIPYKFKCSHWWKIHL